MKIVPYNVASEKKLEFPFINVLLIRILFFRVVRYKHLSSPGHIHSMDSSVLSSDQVWLALPLG